MISIVEATANDFPIIQYIAYKTWPIAYGNILPKKQVLYMLELFYNEAVLLKNYNEKGHCFLLAKEGIESLGFASFEHNYNGSNITHLHKLYVLPKLNGKGIGKALMNAVEITSKANSSSHISLNVNRFNGAVLFYKKEGFEIIRQEDIVLDHGYLMEDYIMQKRL